MKLKQGSYYKRRCKREPWFKHYWAMVLRCRHNKRYKDIKMNLTMRDIKDLYKRDNAKHMRKASLDRIDPKGHYTIENCRFIEFSENVSRAQKLCRGIVRYAKPVLQLSLSGDIITGFPSQLEAQRQTGIKHQNISKVIKGEYKTIGGYKWLRCET